MKTFILILGIICLVLGLIPEPVYQPITKELRIAKVLHKKCSQGVCEITDKEF